MKHAIEFASHPANLCLLRDFVRDLLSELRFSDSEKDLIVLGLDEACTNIIRHAYDHQCDQLICLDSEVTPEGILFRLRDFGRPCGSNELTGRPLEIIRPGGLGLHLMRKAFDSVDFQFQADGTELLLRKVFSSQDAPSV